MKTINDKLGKVVRDAFYDREPELHPQDAAGMSHYFIKDNENVKNLLKSVINKKYLVYYFLSGAITGTILGFLLSTLF